MVKVDGLYYFPNVFNFKSILDIINKGKWVNVNVDNPNSRKVQQFSTGYDYQTSKLIHENVDLIPDYLLPLVDILQNKCDELNIEYKPFNQCIINAYEPGQGIGKHIDSLMFCDVIGCFSCESGANIIFRNDTEKHEIYVDPNSLYIMSGDARFKYTHEMSSCKSDKVNGQRVKRGKRISITFRYIK